MSSPISHWSSSPDSHKSATGDILTPARRVKELLAQFDESDSEQEVPRPMEKDIEQQEVEFRPSATVIEQAPRANRDASENGLPLGLRGRLTDRLQAARSNPLASESSGDDTGNAYERVRKQMLEARTEATRGATAERDTLTDKSEDELSRTGPRRLLLKTKKSATSEADKTSTHTPSASPPAFSSPAKRKSPTPESDSDDLPQNSPANGRSKFLALVEKHRKQRLEKEAAEIAKEAARSKTSKKYSGKAHGFRGSSPGDGSTEDSDLSDGASGARLTQSTRQPRNASKKAEEENKRVIQRMSRNMQLAHEARTRKKITKESLLARFNFSLPGADSTGQIRDGGIKSTTASSAQNSDFESGKEHVTPPTSPLREDIPEKTAIDELPTDVELHQTAYSALDEELPSLEFSMKQPISALDKGKGKAPEASSEPLLEPAVKLPFKKVARPIRVKWSKEDTVMARGADSDSDLEIITSRSTMRKYAAFETLPKRKAKETGSHLALRSLAHLMGKDSKQISSMNNAEMEVSLRKAAREQAQRERQEKIEELKARGVTVQTAEERERDQQEVEDIVELARREAAEIQKREKAMAKKDGTFVKDSLEDDSDDEDDEDFMDEGGAELNENSGTDGTDEEELDTDDENENENDPDSEDESASLIDQEAHQQTASEATEEEDEDALSDLGENGADHHLMTPVFRKSRRPRLVLSEDEDEEHENDDSTRLPVPAKTPQSLPRSARKMIPGLQMSDDLPMGLTQAFAATMADSQTQGEFPESHEQDTLDLIRDLPSPVLQFAPPKLNRLESIDMVSDSQPASQTQPLNISLSFSQSQVVPESPLVGLGITGPQFTPSQLPFEPTQDAGYMLSPFAGSRFGAETPQHRAPNSTIDTVVMPNDLDGSPILQRKGRLRRGRAAGADADDAFDSTDQGNSAFDIMKRSAKAKSIEPLFDKSKSAAKGIVDEAAEESEDEYAGLGGASDDSAGEEDEEDRRMIDEDTQVGREDAAKLAGLFADRERKQDEAAVSKLLKDITTGALRRKRGVGDDLDLSDEEDAAARRREAKRREFAKMRRELLKDEAVGKIAEDQKKQAFLKSIEDHDDIEEDEDDSDEQDTPLEDKSQSQSLHTPLEESQDSIIPESQNSQLAGLKRKMPFENTTDSALNRLHPALRRTGAVSANKRPKTLAEIRDSVSFLIDEPDSQADKVDLDMSDSENEPEAYVDLDRHLKAADENMESDEDLGDFIEDDDSEAEIFKKPELPRRNSDRARFSERRTKQRANVVDRLQLLRQASSSSSSSSSSHGAGGAKMAFFTNKAASTDTLFGKVPALLRRATTNSSLGSMAGRGEEVSATGVVTSANKTERGGAGQEKEFIRKGSGGRRSAVNYSTATAASREKPSDTMKRKLATGKKGMKSKGAGGFLGGLFAGNSWD